MEDFVNHIVEYYNQIRGPLIGDLEKNRIELVRKLTIFARDIRREGAYKDGDFYTIGITDNGVVTNHAGHPERIGYKFDPSATDSAVADTLEDLLAKAKVSGIDGTPACVEDYDSRSRVACAVKVKSDFTSVDVTNIAGLVHEADDSAFKKPDCDGLTLGTTAKDVSGDPSNANLEAYVTDVIRAVQEDIGKITVDEIDKTPGLDLSNPLSLEALLEPEKLKDLNDRLTTRVQERLFCIGSGDFKHENIYVFIMSAHPADSTVLVNGNNFDLNGGNLELKDVELPGEDKKIASLFSGALGDSPKEGNSAYVDYHWNDPTNADDGVPDWFENNVVPGNSPKRSYIEVADLNGEIPDAVAKATDLDVSLIENFIPFPPQLFIFGSGTYNPADFAPGTYNPADAGGDGGITTTEGGGDSGCAIVGAGHTSQSTLLNLFLIASVLFSVVFLRKRARRFSDQWSASCQLRPRKRPSQ